MTAVDDGRDIIDHRPHDASQAHWHSLCAGGCVQSCHNTCKECKGAGMVSPKSKSSNHSPFDVCIFLGIV